MQISCSDRELFVFKKIASVANELQQPCFVIGGFVRDKLLGRNTKDADIVTVGSGIVLAEKVAERFKPQPKITIFKTYGTAQIKLQFPSKTKPEETESLEIEFVGARKESYSAESRNPEVEMGTLEDDQNRRDFTINALAISLNKADYGSLIDPFGGIKHLGLKLIKTPLNPDTTFSDDPLRMLRAIRFAAQLNFSIDEDTFQGIIHNAERIRIVSKERITDELNKIMLSKKPSIGWDLLSKSGILSIIFPQMMALHGAEYKDGVGHKDNFYHTLQVLDNVAIQSNNLWLRWAALLHDIGKPNTKRFDAKIGWTFHGHEAVGARMVPKIFAQLKLPQHDKMRFVQKLVEMHLRPISLTKKNITDSAIRRLIVEAGEDLDDLLILCKADITSKDKKKVDRYLDNYKLVEEKIIAIEKSDELRNWQPPITGEIIMKTFNLTPCKEVGWIKNAVREAILDGEIANNYTEAFAYMIKKGGELKLQPVV